MSKIPALPAVLVIAALAHAPRDVAAQDPLRPLEAPAGLGQITAFGFSQDGRTVACAARRSTGAFAGEKAPRGPAIVIWEAASGRAVLSIAHDPDAPPADWVALSDSARLVAAADRAGGVVRLYDRESGADRGSIDLGGTVAPANGFFPALALSPDGKTLYASVGPAGEVPEFVGIDTGTLEPRFRLKGAAVRALAVAPTGRMLATWSDRPRASSAARIDLRRPETGDIERTILVPDVYPEALGFARAGRILAALDRFGMTAVDIETGEIAHRLAWQGDRWGFEAFALSPNGTRLARAAAHFTETIDVESGRVLGVRRTVYPELWSAVAIAPDLSHAACAQWYPVLVDLARVPPEPLRIRAHRGAVWSVAFSPDESQLATSGEDQTAAIWNAASGDFKRRLFGHKALVRSAAWSPDGMSVATSAFDQTLRFWNPVTGEVTRTLTDNAAAYFPVFSRQGGLLATASADNAARLWNLNTHSLIRKYAGHAGTAWAIALSSDESLLATGGIDRSVRIWKFSTGEFVRSIDAHAAAVNSLAFSRDGKLLASAGSNDRTARIWDVESGALKQTLTGAGDVVYEVAFAPQGDAVAVVAGDGLLRLYDPRSGAILQRLTGGSYCVAFSKSGRLLAAGGSDGQVFVWRR